MNSIKSNNILYSSIRQCNTDEQKASGLNKDIKNTTYRRNLNPAFSANLPVKEGEGVFKKAGSSVMRGIDWLQRYIEKGGFIAEFLVVDFVGMVIPRVYQAYHRNEKELGHPNYAAAKEEFTREILSGPCMFVIPMAFLMGSRRMFGSASQVKLNMLKEFRKASGDAVKNSNTEPNLIKGFYDNVVKTLYGTKTDKIDKEGIVENFINLHHADPKDKDGINKLRNKAAESLMAANKKIGNDEKLGISVADSSGIKFDKTKDPMSVGNFVEDCHNYSTDVVNSLMAAGKEATDFVDKIHNFKEGARKLVTTVAVGTMSAFLLYIPKLYSQNKEYPGLAGLSINNDKNLPKEGSK